MRAVVAIVAAIVLVAAVALVWHLGRDPLAALPKAEGPVAAEPQVIRRSGRVLVRQILDDRALGRIGLAVSFPDPLPPRRLPVVIVVGGLAGGEETLGYIPDPGANVLVGYDWPIPTHLPSAARIIATAPSLYGSILAVPGQLAAAIGWAAAQPWADPDRISLLAFSLGALAAPATQRLVARSGRAIGWTVLAYGGAGLGEMLASHPRLEPDWIKPALARTVDLLLRPVEPASHLPHLAGRFLVISGETDRFVPAAAAQRFQALTPEPKTIVRLPGDHMGVGPGQQALLEAIIDASRDWLLRQGAVNPP